MGASLAAGASVEAPAAYVRSLWLTRAPFGVQRADRLETSTEEPGSSHVDRGRRVHRHGRMGHPRTQGDVAATCDGHWGRGLDRSRVLYDRHALFL